MLNHLYLHWKDLLMDGSNKQSLLLFLMHTQCQCSRHCTDWTQSQTILCSLGSQAKWQEQGMQRQCGGTEGQRGSDECRLVSKYKWSHYSSLEAINIRVLKTMATHYWVNALKAALAACAWEASPVLRNDVSVVSDACLRSAVTSIEGSMYFYLFYHLFSGL